jgi:hypothetical protein
VGVRAAATGDEQCGNGDRRCQQDRQPAFERYGHRDHTFPALVNILFSLLVVQQDRFTASGEIPED